MLRIPFACTLVVALVLALPGLYSVAIARSPHQPEFFAMRRLVADARSLEDARINEPAPASSQPSEADGPSESDETLSPELQELRTRVRRCLATYYHRPVRTAEHSPWGIMHAAIAFGVDSHVYAGDRQVNALGHLCWNGSCRGQRLFTLDGTQLRPLEGPGVQGHPGQFLAILAQSRVQADYQIRVAGRQFTIADLVAYEQRTCRAKTELTFKLIGLSYYLDSDTTWRNDQGEDWSIPRLIEEELAQPVVGGTCGGTHRLMGYTYAVRQREKEQLPVNGQWLRAKQYLEAYHEYTFKLQNADGSFSTSYFEGRADWGDAQRRLESTGHILEWLLYSLPEEQLDDPRVMQAVRYLTTLLLERGNSWEIGPLGHALHGLAIYDERLFGGIPGRRDMTLVHELRKPDGP